MLRAEAAWAYEIRMEQEKGEVVQTGPATPWHRGNADLGIVETATVTDAGLIVMGVGPRTRVDEAVSGSTLRRVLRRAKMPVLVLPVIAGAHEWFDQMTEEDAFGTSSTADATARRAA